jgi:hypothetical protein
MAWRIYGGEIWRHLQAAGLWRMQAAQRRKLAAGRRNKRLAAIANLQCGENGGMSSMANQWRKWRSEEYHIGNG